MTPGFGSARPLLVIGLWFATVTAPGCGPEPVDFEALERARARAAAPEREWRSYLGDAGVSHSSPLRAIDRENVASLELAWSYDAGGASDSGSSQIQFNPLIVKGVLYGATPALDLFALDASTGEELWRFDPGLDVASHNSSRGATYWESGGDERLFFGAGSYLHAVDPRSGRLIEGFGDGGRLDLREGLGRDVNDFMGVVATTPAAVFEDLLIVGGRVGEDAAAAPGPVRAFDVRTGEQRWIFHTIPRPGEPGYETWPPDAWERVGGANAWAGFSVDVERGLVFVPTGSATPDFYGAARAGDNLYANTLLALDARTGARRWHFQLVRHDQWDRDLPAPPNLVEIERDGVRIPAVAQVTKTGDTFVFHRETGAPLFPLREEPVVGSVARGEKPARSQPLPTAPPPFVRQQFTRESVTDRSPEATASVLASIARLRFGPLYTPPSVEGTINYPGLDGGAEWGGAAWDEETGLLFVNANEVPWVVSLVEVGEQDPLEAGLGQGYLALCGGCHGSDFAGDGSAVPSLIGVGERLGLREIYRIVREGRGRMPAVGAGLEWWQAAAVAFWVYNADPEDIPANWKDTTTGPKRFINAGYRKLTDLEGRPGSKPPWGTLSAIDLARGEIRWRIPLGDYPEVLAAGGHGLGAENYGGPVVSAGGLLFIAATPDAKLRAFDKETGDQLWETTLPAAGFATPSLYEAGGREFLVIAAGGGKLGQPSGSRYLAYALP